MKTMKFKGQWRIRKRQMTMSREKKTISPSIPTLVARIQGGGADVMSGCWEQSSALVLPAPGDTCLWNMPTLVTQYTGNTVASITSSPHQVGPPVNLGLWLVPIPYAPPENKKQRTHMPESLVSPKQKEKPMLQWKQKPENWKKVRKSPGRTSALFRTEWWFSKGKTMGTQLNKQGDEWEAKSPLRETSQTDNQ